MASIFLLTGSTGYIGAHLSEHLAQSGAVLEVGRRKGYDLSKSGWAVGDLRQDEMVDRLCMSSEPITFCPIE